MPDGAVVNIRQPQVALQGAGDRDLFGGRQVEAQPFGSPLRPGGRGGSVLGHSATSPWVPRHTVHSARVESSGRIVDGW